MKKIFTLLFLVLLALVAYLVLSSGSLKFGKDNLPRIEKNSVILLDETYQAKAKEVLAVYEKMLADNNFTSEQLAELKNKLLGLKGFQAKFQRLHLDLVLALDRAEDYLNQHDQAAKEAGRKIIEQLKADYSWLNN